LAHALFGSASPENVRRIAQGHCVLGTYTSPGGGTVVTAGCTDWAYGVARRPRRRAGHAQPARPPRGISVRQAGVPTVVATVELTEATFEDTIRGDGIVLVDWWAAWCGPCRAFAPIFDAASERNPDLVFAKVDTDAEEALGSAAGISAIPTLMVFRDNVLVFRQSGALPGHVLDELITKVRERDMEEVQRPVAAQTAAAD
jgi:thioredoxin 1